MNSADSFNQWVNRYQAHIWFGTVKSKYEQLGRVGGIVLLSGLTGQAKVGIVELLGKKPKDKDGAWRISLISLDTGLQRVFGLTLLQALSNVFGNKVVTHNEKRAKLFEETEKRRCYWLQVLSSLYEKNKPDLKYGYLQALYQHFQNSDSALLKYLHQSINKGIFSNQAVVNVIEAIVLLDKGSNEVYRLALFAQTATGDPHAFDFGSASGRLFMKVLTYLFPDEQWELTSVGGRDLLLARVGLSRDSLSSWVVISGFNCNNLNGEDPLIKLSNEHGRYLMVTLQDVNAWTKIDSVGNVAFAVENGQVFEALWEEGKKATNGQLPAILYTGGWFSAAALRFLDTYLIGNNSLYYSGDFEPGGLRIARFLVKRYGRRIKLWRMGEEEYQAALSGNIEMDNRWTEQKENEARKLIFSEHFLEQVQRKAAYQEGLLKTLCKDIVGNLEIRH